MQMGKFKELRDDLDQIGRKQELAAKAFATRLDQHARKIKVDLDRHSKMMALRVVKLERRVADLERRVRKAK